MQETCKSCVLWDGSARLCRAHPPNADGYWPPTEADQWCGEWQGEPTEGDSDETHPDVEL